MPAEFWDKVVGVVIAVGGIIITAGLYLLIVNEGAQSPTLVGLKHGFWGPVDASVDWCEPNYVVVDWIAEIYNSLSSFFTCLVGSAAIWCAYENRAEIRYYVLTASFAVVGLGSVFFHGTLRRHFQACDEVPMLWVTFSGLYCYLELHSKPGQWKYRNLPYILAPSMIFLSYINFAYSGMWSIVLFYASFLPTQLVFIWYSLRVMLSTECRRAKILIRLSFVSYFAAIVSWTMDNAFCAILQNLPYGVPNPHFHAWWHVFIGFAAYGLVIAVLRERLEILHGQCDIKMRFGIWPVTVVTKMK
jgi:dihydroceramidase